MYDYDVSEMETQSADKRTHTTGFPESFNGGIKILKPFMIARISYNFIVSTSLPHPEANLSLSATLSQHELNRSYSIAKKCALLIQKQKIAVGKKNNTCAPG